MLGFGACDLEFWPNQAKKMGSQGALPGTCLSGVGQSRDGKCEKLDPPKADLVVLRKPAISACWHNFCFKSVADNGRNVRISEELLNVGWGRKWAGAHAQQAVDKQAGRLKMECQNSMADYPGRALTFADNSDAAAELVECFPFHFLLSRAGQLLQHGRRLAKICPGAGVGIAIASLFELETPKVSLSPAAWWDNLNLSQLCLLRCRGTRILLHGEFLAMPGGEQFLFVGSPWFNDVTAMIIAGLKLDDFAVSVAGVRLFLDLKSRQAGAPDSPGPSESPDRRVAEPPRDNLESAQPTLTIHPSPTIKEADESTNNLLRLVAARTHNAVIITDREGRTVWVNESFTRITGYSSAEAQGCVPGELCRGVDSSRESLEEIRRALNAGQAVKTELLLQHRSGRPFWLRLESQPVLDTTGTASNFLMVGADITAQMATEAALRAERELLGTILNSMLEGVIVIDEAQRVCLLNPAAEKATGWHRDDARGRQVNEVFTVAGVTYPEGGLVNTQEEWLATALTDQAGGGRPSLADSVVIQTVNGRRMTVSASAVPMTGAAGEVMGGLLVFRDVSSLAEIEQMREDFVHAVSHELNTPLTSITGFIANLRQTPEMPLALRKEFLGIVEKQATRLHNLVKDILEISRVESGGANYDDQPLDLREVAEASLMEVASLAEERKIEVQSCLPETALPFFGDAERLQSVATNLLSNAIKFSREGGRVEFRLEQTGTKVTLIVKDNGLGIPPEAREHIFERFYRVARPGTQIPGTGLGLAIVQRIVRHYNGRIEVESIVEKGSCFRVILPRRNPVRDAATVQGT